MRWLSLLAALAGCASAGVGNAPPPPGDAPDVLVDAGPPPLDAPPPVDAPVEVELVQTAANNVVATQIACQLFDADGNTINTNENSYYRTFPLADFGITVPFHVTSVTFAVEQATAGGGAASQPAQLRIGAYTGTLDATSFPLTALQPLASATIDIPNGATSVTTPITAFTPSSLTVEPGTVLYAEVFVPDGSATGNIFYIGSNNGTEAHPSYIRGPDCDLSNPATYDTVLGGDPPIRILLSVTGTH